jgi:uncharacterized protein YndB with AHSA1/START domain
MKSNTDQIEKTVLLKAPLARVWQAVTDSRAFGHWFGAEFDGPFVAGETTTGRVVGTRIDDSVAEMQKPYFGMACDFMIERIEPMELFSFHWETYPVDDEHGDEDPPITLVTFRFEEVAGGTQLTIVESGFDKIPLARRVQAFADNEQGWEVQSGLLAKYLSQNAQVSWTG